MKRKNLTKLQREELTLTQQQREIVVGCILGDLNVEKDKRAINGNARLRFIQGTEHKEYLGELYEEFKDYCSHEPQIINNKPDKRTGKVYSSIKFNTYSLPCFNEYFDLFYPNGKKIIPTNIYTLLTPLGLAYWICDDGEFKKKNRAVILNTQGFTLEEVELLISVLTDKFDLKCTINKNKNGYVIRISAKSLSVLQNLCALHMPNRMKYKIGL